MGTVCLVKRSLPERPPPRIVVLVGPSGVGRGRLLDKLVEELPDKFGLTVSHTTRKPRYHEVNGKDYFFTKLEGFMAALEDKALLEHAAVATLAGTFMYGTSYATVREVAATGRLCLMGLDAQGVRMLKGNKRIDGLYVYVRPPSMETLEERQRGRLKEAEPTIQARLGWAQNEVGRGQRGQRGRRGVGGCESTGRRCGRQYACSRRPADAAGRATHTCCGCFASCWCTS